MILSLRRWPLVATVALACLPGAAAAQRKRPLDKPEVVDLTIKGVKVADEDELLESLAIQESRCRSLALKPFCWFTKSKLFYQRAYLDHDELARDVVRAKVFYYLRGYRETGVDTIVRPSGKNAVKVTLVVHEGEPTIVEGVTVAQTKNVLTAKDVSSRLVLQSGQPLNVFALDSTRVQVRDRLWEKGYADAIVDTAVTVDPTRRRASVLISVNPRAIARVASIAIEGDSQVSERTILKSLTFKPGDIYRRSDVLQSQRKLYESNLFRRAQITVARPARRDSATARTDSTRGDSLQRPPERLFSGADSLLRRQRVPDSLKRVLIAVTEAPPRVARISTGFNTIDFIQVEGRYTNYNWHGGARQLNLLATMGNLLARQLNGSGIFYDVSQTVVGAGQGKYYVPTYNVSADIRQPWFGSPQNEIALGVFTHRRIAPGIYVDRGYGTSATFTRELTERAPASLNYRFEETVVDAGMVYFCIAYGVCDIPTLEALRKGQRLSPLTAILSLDKTDAPYVPRRGYRARFDAEHASGYTASDFRYNRVAGDASAFLPIGRRAVLGGHVRLGYVKAIASTTDALGVSDTAVVLHPRKRFYSGGANSVRGYQENQLGPRVLTVSQERLRGDPANGGCPTSTPIAQCNPNVGYLRDRDFDPRPLGGNAVAEATVEFRFPVLTGLLGDDFLAAVFVDAGYVSQNTNRDIPKSRAAVTPGFGFRYLSPVGPVRIDVGINPITREELAVVTEDGPAGQRTLVTLANKRLFSPVTGFLSRLTLHLAIGEAF